MVTCGLTKDTGEFGFFGETLLRFDLQNSARGIQTVQTEISNTEHLSDFLRQSCLLQQGCIIEHLS